MPEREQQHFEPELSSKLDPKAYLEQHLEPKREGIATPEGLSAPLAENVEYTDDPFNKLEVTRDGLSLEIVYGESATYKVMRAVESYLSFAQTKESEFAEWRQLYSLKLRNEKGQQLDLDFSANTNGVEKGKPTTVVFRAGVNRPTNATKSTGALRHTVTEDRIFIPGNLLSPGDILLLLHELGHAAVLNKYQENDERKLVQVYRYLAYVRTLNHKRLNGDEESDPDINEKIFGTLLQEERDAWAFAIKKFKPFIGSAKITREAVLALVHEKALQSYSNTFRTMLGPTLGEKIRLKIVSYINTLLNA